MDEVTVAGRHRQHLRKEVYLHMSGQINTTVVSGQKISVFRLYYSPSNRNEPQKVPLTHFSSVFKLCYHIIRIGSGKKKSSSIPPLILCHLLLCFQFLQFTYLFFVAVFAQSPLKLPPPRMIMVLPRFSLKFFHL